MFGGKPKKKKLEITNGLQPGVYLRPHQVPYRPYASIYLKFSKSYGERGDRDRRKEVERKKEEIEALAVITQC
jgi:hypothetical protein